MKEALAKELKGDSPVHNVVTVTGYPHWYPYSHSRHESNIRMKQRL